MRLRNKKTGDIWEFDGISMPISDSTKEKLGARGCSGSCYARSLSELNEEWEDYEPEEFWFINECGDVLEYKYNGGCSCPILEAKAIGNYFETKEEAEKAVEKLKALKRLKDNGLEFENWKTWEKVTGHACLDRNVAHSYYAAFTFRSSDRPEEDEQVKADLDLLFGEGA